MSTRRVTPLLLAGVLLTACSSGPAAEGGDTRCPLRPSRQVVGFVLDQWRSEAPFTTIACTNTFRCSRQVHRRDDATIEAGAAYTYRGPGDPRVTYLLRVVKSRRVLLSRKGAIVVHQVRVAGCGSYGGVAVITVGRDGNLSIASQGK